MSAGLRLLLSVVVSLVSLVMTAPSAPAAAANHGACVDLTRCRVVDRVDVNGDRVRDEVGVAEVGPTGSTATQQRRALVSVRLGDSGRLVRVRISSARSTGPLYLGAVRLDNRRGRELVIRGERQAFTAEYRVLTWRSRSLALLRAPGLVAWSVAGDQAPALAYTGWQRGAADRAGVVRLRMASSADQGATYSGEACTYRYRRGQWDEVAHMAYPVLTPAEARAFAGWVMPGVRRF